MIDDLTTAAPVGPFFRFPDEATGMAALEAAALLNEDGEFITASHEHSLDVIGVITRGGEYDPETGDVITPPTVLSGWHLNLQGKIPNGWEHYAVYPRNPVRVWA